MPRMYKLIKRELKILGVSLLAGVVCLAVFAITTWAYASHVQGSISDNIVRLHVISNSNSYEDQKNKYAVRDAVLAHIPELAYSPDKKSSIDIIQGVLPELESIASQVLGGSAVRASIGRGFFPQMSYGPLRIPSGSYTALRVYIGEASGDNWWCVMFPPLCFVEESTAEASTEGLELFASVMPEYAYDIISHETAEIRFAIVDWWNSRD